MPFDGSVTDVGVVLLRARRLLYERGICFGMFRNVDGQLCSASAISEAADYQGHLVSAARKGFEVANGIARPETIERWHDRRPFGVPFLRPSRRDQVLAAFDRAIERA